MLPATTEICAAFADLFADPLQAGDIEALRADDALGRLAPLAGWPGCGEPWQRARAALAAAGGTEAAVSTLNAAFCRLFLGVGGPAQSAPPYQSAYVGTGRLFAEPETEMAAMLARHGLVVQDNEAADHLAVELLALSALLAAGDPEAAALHARIAGWLPDFAAACAAGDASGFYAALAALLFAFLAALNAELPPGAASDRT